MQTIYNLADRLIRFAADGMEVAEAMPNSAGASYLPGLLVRLSVSPALPDGEACSAESIAGIIHKMKVCGKE